ncbi:MAG: polymer-forming cytoskeletal protein [Asgard group archaeon]|nr:polymer-forming cytoskeletal protein [Asgard group archaeon]
MTSRYNYQIKGSNRTFGNREYDNLTIRGSYVNEGDITASITEIFGSATINGNLTSKYLLLRGSMRLKGNLMCPSIEIPGSAYINGKLVTKNLFLRGSLHVREDIKASKFCFRGSANTDRRILIDNNLTGKGSVRSDKDIIAKNIDIIGSLGSSESIKADNEIIIEGKVKAENVESKSFYLLLSGESEIQRKLEAEKIRIGLSDKAKKRYFLKVKEIICKKSLEIDYVIADKVKCPNAKIGPNCRIGVIKK